MYLLFVLGNTYLIPVIVVITIVILLMTFVTIVVVSSCIGGRGNQPFNFIGNDMTEYINIRNESKHYFISFSLIIF